MPSVPPANGNNTSISPAIPVVAGLPIAVGHNGVNGALGPGHGPAEHSRKASLTISAAAAATGYMPNGEPILGSSARPGSIQFGSVNAAGSPAASYSAPQPVQPASSLAVAGTPNPRLISPQSSPSPIPQPPVSGGRPPAGLQGQANAMNFGSLGGEPNEGPRSMRPSMQAGQLGPGPQSSHLRRESSQSAHSDMTNASMANGPARGGYPVHHGGGGGGRGRGYGQSYAHQNAHPHHQPHQQQHAHPPPHPHQQMGFASNPGFRGMPNPGRGGPNMNHHFQVQPTNLRPYPDSPHRGSRSPAPIPGTPQMQQQPVPMVGAPVQPAHFATAAYLPSMGAPQVNSSSPSSASSPPSTTTATTAATNTHPLHLNQLRQTYLHSSQGAQASLHDQLAVLPTPNLSPEHGFMEHYLMMRHMQATFGMPPPFDPAYGPMPGQVPLYHQTLYMGQTPNSPRPQYHHVQPAAQQHYHPGQYGSAQPQPMSRTSSAVSDHRPSSSMGQQAPTPSLTPAVPSASQQQGSQGKNSPAPTSNFKIPARTSAVIIKDPNTLAVKTFDRQAAAPVPAAGSPVIVSSTAPAAATSAGTPPPGRGTDPPRPRSESKVVKSDEEKKHEMKDAIAKKIEADKAEEKRRKEDEERRARERAQEEAQRLAREKEEAERAQKEAADKAQREKEEAEREQARREAEEKAKKEAEERAEREAEERARKEADEKARREEEERVQKEREAEEARKRKEEQDAQEALASKQRDDQKQAEMAAREAERLRGAASSARKEEERSAKERAEADSTKDGSNNVTGITGGVGKLAMGDSASNASADGLMPPPPRPTAVSRQSNKPAPLNIPPITTKSVDPAQPSAALQSLRSARFIDRISDVTYPKSIASPNPSLHATSKSGFRYDRLFLMQFQPVFLERPAVEWEHMLKDTVGGNNESARPQSARTPSMGPRNLSARGSGGPPNPFAMGQFAQAGRTIPAGTTSDQRFANSNMQRPPMSNPLAQFARPGGFPMGAGPPSMIRNNSSASLSQSQNVVPQSPRGGPNRSQRNNSKRRDFDKGPSKAEEQAAKTMPLTANAEVKPLLPSSTGWKPRIASAANSATGAAGPPPGAAGGHMEPDMVQRKVKAALNKMTPEKFDKISDQILDIAAQSKNETDGRTLRQVIQLTFEKATDEAHWASMYAKFCTRMLESMSPEIKDESITDKNGNVVTGGNLFRKYLLNRCQEEFERGWKINLPPKPEGETEEAAMLSDEYYIAAAAKRRGLGLVQFIGELYKLSMLTERIMHECVKKLVDYEGMPDEAEVESLTKLLRTIGLRLENSDRGKPLMDVYFARIQNMIDTPELPSRLKFMLMDVVDLRKHNWASKDDNKGPQTLQEIREKAERERAEKEAEKNRQTRHGGGGRMPSGRGDARSFSGGGYFGNMPPPDVNKNTVGMDELRKLGKNAGSRQANQGPVSFGPTSMFSGRSTSGRKPLGPGASVRGGEESGASSRTGTPPATKEKESSTSANAFGPLASLDGSGEPADPASPPLTGSSPPTGKAKAGAAEERTRGSQLKSDKGKDGEPPAGSS